MSSLSLPPRTGGAGRDRTGDLLNANQALSQLSYSPFLPVILAIFSEADWTWGSRAASAWERRRDRKQNLSGETGVEIWSGTATTYCCSVVKQSSGTPESSLQ